MMKENLESGTMLKKPEETYPEVVKNTSDATLSEIFNEPPMKVMPTLPKSFKSLVDIPIDITNETRTPKNIIALLGDALGVSDYETNIASFWFLDFIALQVLKYETVLDSHSRSVLVSWLAGQINLIRDRDLSREDFFREMEEIFVNVAKNISAGHALQHWDLMMLKNLEEDIPVPKDMEQEANKSEESTEENSKHRINSKSDKKISASESRSKLNENTLKKRIGESKNSNSANDNNLSSSKDNSHQLLDVIMEATYCMYGHSFHYALIVAAFVKPVILHEYTLPFTLRTPRPLKTFDIEKDGKKKIDNVNGSTKKKKDIKKNKSQAVETNKVAENPSTPITLTEEEILSKQREHILPLMESNEALSILEAYKQENTQRKNIAGSKKKIVK